MAYPHDAFPFPMESQSQSNMYFHPTIQYAPFLQQPQQYTDIMMFPHPGFPDYSDYMSMGLMHEDYEDGTEVSTRPRLTKEQVEVLESQFQAHPKPNSMIKKQLAIQTKLTLPRVANWFQNRRAKAKQQRKQEEFEISQNLGINTDWQDECNTHEGEALSKASSPSKAREIHDEVTQRTDAKSSATSDSGKNVDWASLQRSLDAADVARQQRQHRNIDQPGKTTMLPPERSFFYGSSSKASQSPSQTQTASVSPTSEWTRAQSIDDLASPLNAPTSFTVRDLGFDFGFDQISSTNHSNAGEDSPNDNQQQYIVSPRDWHAPLPDHTQSMPCNRDVLSTNEVSAMPLARYGQARRGSGVADDLAADMGTFALGGTPPVSVVSLSQMAAPSKLLDGEIDLASRRKRPRPAALPLSSLRSRSYGQLSSTSPGFRSGPPSGNALRHVKSTGHGLNSHYAGIRKSSLPQKSPLNLASFTEAEALKKLVAQQNAAVSSKTPLTTPANMDVGPMTFPNEMTNQVGPMEEQSNRTLASEMLARFQNLYSPPHTPFQPDYMMQAMNGSMPPPSSVRSQYASFVDYTPPYSAGPLTNSTCWSDAPLQSPDVTGYPPGHFMSSLAISPRRDDPTKSWILPSDGGIELGLQSIGPPDENTKTEFFITEFPGQKEEYANIAQHTLQPKPKNYVFANTAPSDYDI